MFNTNSFFLNRFQSYFQAPRRRRFQTNRFNKAERLDNTRGEQYGQESIEFESRTMGSLPGVALVVDLDELAAR